MFVISRERSPKAERQAFLSPTTPPFPPVFLKVEILYYYMREEIIEVKKIRIKSTKGKGIKNNISSNNNKMANSWVQYVKEYASKNGMSYRDTLRDPKCKAEYYSKKTGAGVVDEKQDNVLIAERYNKSQLGANSGKKYISL